MPHAGLDNDIPNSYCASDCCLGSFVLFAPNGLHESSVLLGYHRNLVTTAVWVPKLTWQMLPPPPQKKKEHARDLMVCVFLFVPLVLVVLVVLAGQTGFLGGGAATPLPPSSVAQ